MWKEIIIAMNKRQLYKFIENRKKYTRKDKKYHYWVRRTQECERILHDMKNVD